MTGTAAKARYRAQFTQRRAQLSIFAREQSAAELSQWLYEAPFRLERGVTVAAYVPVGDEPGSLSLLDELVELGVRVIVPGVPDGAPTALNWVTYLGQETLHSGRFGLAEPGGQRLGTAALHDADLVLVPALGVDRRGVRLGRGAGYYDRSLGGLTAPLVAVVYDDEFVDELPEEPTDVRVDWALTPQGGFVELR